MKTPKLTNRTTYNEYSKGYLLLNPHNTKNKGKQRKYSSTNDVGDTNEKIDEKQTAITNRVVTNMEYTKGFCLNPSKSIGAAR
jgi:hypothetical protein